MIDASINKNIEHIALRLKTIPETPGVYQYLDASGTVIYVGKARNLHRRVSSYFMRYDDHSAKIKMLVRHIHDVRITVVATEVDALLLENNLIKQFKPRYNSLLKDDKTYPYLCLTAEEYPRLVFTRNREKLRGQFFGPYPKQTVMNELQDILRSLFPYRTCSLPLSEASIARKQQRPCLKHQMGLCKAPCAGLQTREDYINDIEGMRQILKGDFSDALKAMEERMFALAEELRFEEAEQMKRRIVKLKEYQAKSTVVNTNVRDVDVVTIAHDDSYAYVNMMRIKQGSIIYSFCHEIRKSLDESDAELLSTLIPALHEKTESTAHEVIVPMLVDDLPEAYLKQTVPTQGDRLKLLELSQRNALSYQKQCAHQRALLNPEEHQKEVSRKEQTLLMRIQKELHLKELPVNIECFDNSNTQGSYPVAGMVRFTNGKPNRNEYRRFNIKTVEGPDDYASMAEVIHRRYKRLVEEHKPLPQLLIVDGGEGQMEVARRVIQDELHLDLPIAGLAKNDRHHTSELLYGFPPQVIGLKPNDPLFHLLERIQDEVHRYAISFHREKRGKALTHTQLTDIRGIGEKTARELLLRFGSVKAIKALTLPDLVLAIGPTKARLVFDHFNPSA
ncbi:MAG: excinuclease ABC subunit C, partial [Bacteroidales bacterium]|nr:excinuclease ABC subunit C [Bacteroidales bacterium]